MSIRSRVDRPSPWLIGILLPLAFSLIAVESRAQSEYAVGTLPVVSFRKEWAEKTILEFDVESRQFYVQGVFGGEDPQSDFLWTRTDVKAVILRKLQNDHLIGGGYLFRYDDVKQKSFHRIIQQYKFSDEFDSFELGHQFKAEQIFGEGSKPRFRFRYALKPEFPLGESDDSPRALSAKVENLYSIQGDESVYEVRLGAKYSFPVFSFMAMAVGPEYRVSPLNESDKEHQFLLVIAFDFEG